ncbi:MAG: polyprenyl synthetase family protein [Gemmatimonadaceae bacterium]
MTVPARPRSSITEALTTIQAPVRSGLDSVGAEMERIVTAEVPLIAEVCRHLLQMKGKMFRPTLALLSGSVEGPAPRRTAQLAAVVELIHLATLIHDDAVDHSALRRGMPTINARFSHQISVIMGDFLYSRALAELVRHGEIDAMGVISNASIAMTVGEMRQLAAIDRLSFTEDEYYTLIRAKTAALMSAACEVGAIAGAPRFRTSLARYGVLLGMAFQIADDVLDYTEHSAVTGKPSGLDLREHKVTLPLISVLPHLPRSARSRVDALFATPDPDDDLISEVVGIVAEAGGIDAARGQGERFADQAEDILDTLPAGESRNALAGAITYVMHRRW